MTLNVRNILRPLARTRGANLLILIVATAIALVVATMVYARMPRLYNASTLVSDETQEMTIAVGLSQMGVRESERLLDNPEVYKDILDAPDFIEGICAMSVDPDGALRYGVHLNDQMGRATATPVTREEFGRYVKYVENRKACTIEVSVFDSDPLVAALVADSVVARLQKVIREKMDEALKSNERALGEACDKARIKEEAAREAYSAYCDSHRDAVAPQVLSEMDRLKKEAALAHDETADLCEQHLRARFLLQQSAPSFTVVRRATVPLWPLSPQPLVVYGAALIIGLVVGWWLCLLRRRLLCRRRERRNWQIDFGGLFSPWTLTLLVWAAILVIIRLEAKMLYPLTEQFYTALALWVPSLCATALVTYLLMGGKTERTPEKKKRTAEGVPSPSAVRLPLAEPDCNRLVFNVLLALSIVMTPLYAWNVYQIVSQFSVDDMLNNVRLLANEGEGQGVLRYAIVINQALLIVALWRYPRIAKWQLAAVIASCLLGAVAIMEKGSILFVLLMCIFVLFERGTVRLRTIVAVGIAAVIGFYFFNLARETEEYAQNETFLDFVATYLASPAVAFSRLSADLTPQIGTNTFEFFYAVFDKFGIGQFEVHEKLQDFVWVPMPTNVYTVMQPFYIDFGYGGVAFFGALYGVVFGALYRMYRNGSFFARACYSYGVFILALQFYQDNFMLSLSYNIQLAILFFLLLPTTRRQQ